MVTKLILLLGVLAPALCFIDMVEKIVKLWPEADPTYDDVARISYSDLVNGDVDSLIKQSMQEYGIFYVVDVPNYDSHEELKYLQQFFNLPEELKAGTEIRRHNPANKNAYRGYCPGLDDVDATLQYKNLFNIGPHETRVPIERDSLSPMDKLRYDIHEPNVWPQTGDCAFDKEFKELFQKGFEIRQNIARAFVRSIARSMEIPQLNDLFQEDEFSAMGLRRYPYREQINTNMYSDFDGTLLRELEHVDSTITVLTTFHNTGLQALYNNKYRDVPVTGDDKFIVNIGKLVDDLIDNKLVDIKHRVAETTFDRHSITYFLGPQFDADISRSVTNKLTEAGNKYQIFGEWIKDYLGAIELFYY
uniref:Putative isopenicillin-n-synthase n=1 Tax=Ctenophora sp. T WRF-2014 TaxID=1567052 RepID=A0A0A0S1S2_9METZ|nr:putative isopenicillin-n-synthase [Ctenophora sp. T WRF-2014]